MFTKLGQALINNFPQVNNYTVVPGLTTSQKNAIFSFKDYTGTDRNMSATIRNGSPQFIKGALSGTSYGVALGSGTTAATENDYNLETKITTLDCVVTPSMVYDSVNYKYISRLMLTISNNTDAAITVNELGLFVWANWAATRGDEASNNSNSSCFMTEHTVLENGIEIAAGEGAVIYYEFTFPTTPEVVVSG